MAASDNIYAAISGFTKGAQDILGLEIQRRIRRAERQEQDYIDVDEIPQSIKDKLGITQETGRIRKEIFTSLGRDYPTVFLTREQAEKGALEGTKYDRGIKVLPETKPEPTLTEKEKEARALTRAREEEKQKFRETTAQSLDPFQKADLEVIINFRRQQSLGYKPTPESLAQTKEATERLGGQVEGFEQETEARYRMPIIGDVGRKAKPLQPIVILPENIEEMLRKKGAKPPAIRGGEAKESNPLGLNLGRR